MNDRERIEHLEQMMVSVWEAIHANEKAIHANEKAINALTTNILALARMQEDLIHRFYGHLETEHGIDPRDEGSTEG